MIDSKTNVNDDELVDNDNNQGTSDKESEEKYQTVESKKDEL